MARKSGDLNYRGVIQKSLLPREFCHFHYTRGMHHNELPDLAPSSVASRGSLVAHLGASAWKRLKAVPRYGNYGDEIQASRGVGKPKGLLLSRR